MFGQLICIIGGANQGKSYFTKELIMDKKIPCFVYDYQDCFGDTSTKKGDLITNLVLINDAKELHECKRARYYGDHNTFISLSHNVRGRNIVIEEATIFLEGKTFLGMRKLMVDRYHHKNNIIIMFHSINAVPPRILEMSNTCVLFKTGDAERIIKNKYAKLLPYFQELQGTPDRSKKIIKMI
jgi:hypothetical protein